LKFIIHSSVSFFTTNFGAPNPYVNSQTPKNDNLTFANRFHALPSRLSRVATELYEVGFRRG
jgi:hypothetical protein